MRLWRRGGPLRLPQSLPLPCPLSTLQDSQPSVTACLLTRSDNGLSEGKTVSCSFPSPPYPTSYCLAL